MDYRNIDNCEGIKQLQSMIEGKRKMSFNICLNCMEPLSEDVNFCPNCGKRLEDIHQRPEALPLKTVLENRYIIGRVLGKGGFGITYLAYDMTLQSKTAIKEYYPVDLASRQENLSLSWNSDRLTEEKACDSFLKEARKMAQISQLPNVVTVRDVFRANHTAYIVMEYIEGDTLASQLAKYGPISFEDTMDLMMPVMNVVSKMHKYGLIHRDIKPDNIMLRADGEVILLDMGAAKNIDIDRPENQSMTTNLTVTQGFSPLEQYTNSRSIGPWTDVYALSMTIYYCLTRRKPPTALDRSYGGEYYGLERPQCLSDYQWNALKKGMALKISDRCNSVEELKNTLLMQEMEIEEEPPVNPPVAPPKKQSWLGVAIAVPVAVLVLAGAAFLGYRFLKGSDVIRMDKNAFLACSNKEDIRKIVFQDEQENLPSETRDLSEKKNEGILSWEEDGVLYISGKKTIGFPEDSSSLFSEFTNVESIDFGDSVDTSKTTNMEFLFGDADTGSCSSLKKIDLSGWNTESLQNAGGMFWGCASLEEIDLSSWNTENLENIGGMFWGCTSLKEIDLSSWNTENITYMACAFYECSALESLNLENWDTAQVEDMHGMFVRCNSMKSQDFTDWNTEKVQDMSYMFYECSGLSEENQKKKLNIPKDVNTEYMFEGCRK